MVSSPWDTACTRVRDALFKAFSQAPDTDAPETCLAALNAAFPGSGLALQAAGVLQYRALTDLDRQVLDEALHQLVMQLILQALDAQQPMMQYRPPGASPSGRPVMPRLLRALSWLSRQSLAVPIPAAVGSPGLRLVECAALCRVLEDCLEAGTLEDGRQVFSLMEEAGLVEAILRESSSAAKLCALRSCNGLLRKLSKSQDLVLAGRILIFIARVHSLDDKSGVNLHSAVNSGLALPLDEVVGDGVDSSGEPIDARLYTTFWGLQTVFKNPSQALQTSMWTKTCADINTVLDELAKRKITVKAGHSFALLTTAAAAAAGQTAAPGLESPGTAAGGQGGLGPAGCVGQGGGGSAITVKYLSSSKLFGLQLRDEAFRRQFLVQCLVLLHYVTKPGARDKVPAGARFEGCELVTERIYEALGDSEEGGAEFASAMRHLLQRESKWVDWKAAGCPPFDKPAITPPSTSFTTEPSRSAAQQPAAAGGAGPGGGGGAGLGPPGAKRRRTGGRPAAPAGSSAAATGMLRLVVMPVDQMAGLAAAERKLLPDFRGYVAPVIEDMAPESCVEEQFRRLKTDKLFNWQVTRMISRCHLEQLSKFKAASGDTQQDIERAVLEIFPDIRAQFDASSKAQAEAAAAEASASAAAAAAEAAAAALAETVTAAESEVEQLKDE